MLHVLNAHRILPRLWQGAAPPYDTALAELHVDALVLCALEHQPPADMFPGVQVHHAPNDDADRPPSRAEMLTAARAALWTAERVAKGQRVLVTCMQGRNRSGLVTALASHVLTGWDGATCARLVQRNRPRALTNPHFVDVLERLPARVQQEIYR